MNPITGRPRSLSARRSRRPRRPAADGGPWAGRWSLLPRSTEPLDPERLVWLLVQRHGLLARELVAQEHVVRWSELYPVLCQLELAGELARGMFVEGLGPAQFAPSDMVDRLRAHAPSAGEEPMLLSSCDPALVAPALGLPLPGGSLTRRSSTYVVLEQGMPVLVAETAGGRLHLDDASVERQQRWLARLGLLLKRGHRGLRIERVNGEPVLGSSVRGVLEGLGYRVEGKGLEIRRHG